MDIVAWLRSIGLEEHADLFRSQQIDMDVLPQLTIDDLRELGLPLGPRKRIALALDTLRSESAATGAGVDPALLPTVLAHALSNLIEEPNPVLGLWHACDLVELLLRFAVFLGAAELRQRGAIPPEVLRELSHRIEEPTLGKWKLMAVAVARHPLPDAAVPECNAFILEEIVPLLDPDVARTPETSLTSARNQLAHGGGVTRGAARKLLDLWRPRILSTMAKARWLAEIDLVIRDASGRYRVLRGPSGPASPWSAGSAELEVALERAFRRSDDVVLARGARALQLWPLSRWATARLGTAEVSEEGEIPQVFVRRGELRLQYTPVGSDSVCLSESDDGALQAFLEFFQLHQAALDSQRSGFQIRDFEAELRRDANRLLGRREELEQVHRAIAAIDRGVLWLDGPAGSGKSYVVARAVVDFLDAPPPDLTMLAYRFRAGDDRCNVDSFLRFAVERVAAAFDDESGWARAIGACGAKPIDQLRDLVTHDSAPRLLVVLDGVDELGSAAAALANDVVFGLRAKSTIWLCAGRTEGTVGLSFAPPNARPVFEGGLPPMATADVRLMLLERIGTLRKRLVLGDREDAENRVVNPFVERVAANAQGLPIYVTYVIGDILANRYRALDVGEQLPPSLERYHAELLARCGIGILQQLVSPLVATLALALEPLSEHVLLDLLQRGNVLPRGPGANALLERGVGAVSSMLRRVRTVDGDDGLTLFHQSLREFMARDPSAAAALETAQRNICELTVSARGTGTADRYLLRRGIAHLLHAGRPDEAARLMGDIDYLLPRLQALPGAEGVRGMGDDFSRFDAEAIDPRTSQWSKFWRSHRHILSRGDAHWSTDRILLQLALNASGYAALRTQAEAHVASHRPSHARLRVTHSGPQEEPPEDLCLCTLIGHGDTATACALSADGRVGVSGAGSEWAYDYSVRVWDLEREHGMATLLGHTRAVTSVAVSGNGAMVASASLDGTARVWDSRTGDLVATCLHRFPVQAVALSPDGSDLVTSAEDGVVRLWEARSGRVRRVLGEHDCAVTAMVTDADWRTVVSGDEKGNVRRWSLHHEAPSQVLKAHSGRVLSLAASGETLASGGADGFVRLWDLHTQALRREHPPDRDDPGAVALIPGTERVLVARSGRGGRFTVSDVAIGVLGFDGAQQGRLAGHVDMVCGVAVSADGSRALSCSRDYTVRVWDLTAPPARCLPPESINGADAFDASPTATRCVVASPDGAVRTWNVATPGESRLLGCHEGMVMDAAVSPDARWVASAGDDRRLNVWSLDDGALVAGWTCDSDTFDAVAFSPDGSRIICSHASMRHEAPAGAFIEVRSLQSGALERRIDVGRRLWMPRNLRVMPDGRLVVGGETEKVPAIWDLRTGAVVRRFTHPMGDIRGVAVTPDGRHVLSGTESGEVYAWAVSSGERIRSFVGHGSGDYVRGVAMTPDGRHLLTASDETGVRVWEFATGALLAAAHSTVWSVAARPIGATGAVVVATGLGPPRIYETEGLPPTGPLLVTGVRTWRGQASGWDSEVSALCPACGVRSVMDQGALEAIGRIADGGDASCLSLPEEAWLNPALAATCRKCGSALRYNPFIGS